MNVQITGQGMEKVLLDLERLVLDTRDGRRLRATMKRACQPLVRAMKDRCPVDPKSKTPGALKKSIQARAIRTRNWKEIGVIVGPSKDQKHIARFVEYGFLHKAEGGAKHVSAKPFLRPAWDSTHGTVMQEIVIGVRIALDQARRG